MHEDGNAGTRQPATATDGRLSQDELRTITSHLAAQEDLWRPRVVHDPAAHWCTQLLWSPQVEIWLVGWDADQGLDLHDHGGVSGAFTICEGTLEVRQGSHLRPAEQIRQRTLRAADSVAFDGDYLHEVVNRSGEPATSIHAYSPAILNMDFYEMVAGELVMARRETVGAPEPGVVATPAGAGRS
jgi:hypothetical protein